VPLAEHIQFYFINETCGNFKRTLQLLQRSDGFSYLMYSLSHEDIL